MELIIYHGDAMGIPTIWQAVLAQALEDVICKEYVAQSEAVVWFFRKNNDFEKICVWSDLDPDKIRGRAFSMIINGNYRDGYVCQQSIMFTATRKR